MSVKKTIGILDASTKWGIEIAERLANTDCRLLLISDNSEKLNSLAENLKAEKCKADIVCMECVKEGCWEADIIIWTMAVKEEKAIAERMKEVAIQKIVVKIDEEENSSIELQSLLPYSKLINIYWDYPSKEMEIKGSDNEALMEVTHIFENAGLFLKQSIGN
jgi:hypothetical protein